jgi:O-antigen ligase
MLVPLALGTVALFLTFSRAATLAFGVGLVVVVATALWDKTTRRRRALELALAGLVVAVALVFPLAKNQAYVAQRIGLNNSFNDNSGENRSLVERDALIASTNRIFYKHAVVGVGNGALPMAMLKLDDQFPTEFFYQPAHFVLLDAAAELGIFGGMFWLWLIIAPVVAFLLARRAALGSPWLAASAGVLLALILIGFFDYYPWLSAPGRIWQWSAWGLFGQVIAQRATDSAST